MADRVEQELETATRNVADARNELVKAMRRARRAGWSVREIAEHTDMSHQSVWRLLRDD